MKLTKLPLEDTRRLFRQMSFPIHLGGDSQNLLWAVSGLSVLLGLLVGLFIHMSYFFFHTELINTPCSAEAEEWSADNTVQALSTVTLHDCGNCLITLPLLKHYSIAVCGLHSSIFTTTKLEDQGFYWSYPGCLECINNVESSVYETRADRSSHSKQYHSRMIKSAHSILGLTLGFWKRPFSQAQHSPLQSDATLPTKMQSGGARVF